MTKLKRFFGIITLVLILSAFILSSLIPVVSASTSSFTVFCDNLLKDLVQDDPEALTYLGNLEKYGIRSRNGELTDVSSAAMERWYNACRKNLAALGALDRSGLSPVEQASADSLEWFLNDQLHREAFAYHEYPVEMLNGIHVLFPDFLVNYHPVTDKQSAEDYISRLLKCGVRFDQVISLMKAAEQKGIRPPRIVIDQCLSQVLSFIRPEPAENVLYTVFAGQVQALSGLKDREKKSLLAEAQQAVAKTVYPAYQRLQYYLTDLRPRARTSDGVWDLPGGDAYYRWTLRHHTSTELTPEEIHQIGLSEVARLQAEMLPILHELGMTAPTVGENIARLSIQDTMFYSSGEILTGYRDLVREIQGWLPQVFDIMPQAPVEVRAQPEFRSGPNIYSIGSLDGSRPGFFGVNVTYAHALRDMKLLACHETVPGHHLQLGLQAELSDIPAIQRTYIVGCNAFIEGWALYAERLAGECGYFKTPQEKFAALWSEYYRALRLVTETGIHAKKWTRAEAMNYMRENAGTRMAYEVDRYIVMPGQACSYKIGQLKILELRDRARKALGNRFDIKEFHRVVLRNGAVPLPVLERQVQRYIDEKRS